MTIKTPCGHHIAQAQLCRAESSQLRHVSTIGKNLLNSNISSTCPHDMANFGPQAAEIGSGVWGTAANFNGFRVFAALLHAILAVGVSQTAALNSGCHMYSAGRPSRWALAHILVKKFFPTVNMCLIMAALCSRCRHYIFSSPNLSGRRLDVYTILLHIVWP